MEEFFLLCFCCYCCYCCPNCYNWFGRRKGKIFPLHSNVKMVIDQLRFLVGGKSKQPIDKQLSRKEKFNRAKNGKRSSKGQRSSM